VPPDKTDRRFRRFSRKSDIAFSSHEASFKAAITDYSLKGIGFFSDAGLSIPAGSSISFSAPDLCLTGEGRLVWLQSSRSGTRGGIEKELISGSLRYHPLPDVFGHIRACRRTGVLEIFDPPRVKKIYFSAGEIVNAASSVEEERLIELLLRTGRINEDQYYQAIAAAEKQHLSHGVVLVRLGLLKPEDLVTSVKNRAEQIIVDIFQWEEGIFRFTEGLDPGNGVGALKIDATDLIYRGISGIRNSSSLLNSMPSLDTVLCLGNGGSTPDNFILDAQGQDTLHLVDGKKRIRDILADSTNHLQRMKSLYALLASGLVEVHEKDSMEDRRARPVGDGPGASPEFLKKIDLFYEKVEAGDYYAVLKVERTASPDEIKKGYYQAAKEFHPDRHQDITCETYRHKLNTIFSALTSVYKTLSDSARRHEYDRASAADAGPKVAHHDHRLNNEDLARSRFRQGKDALRRGAYSEARQLFAQAAYLDSGIAEYHFFLGLAYVREKNYREARKSFGSALELDPYNPEYTAELGHCFAGLGLHLRARSTFEKALRLAPDNKRAIEGIRSIAAG
jgi:curved DNA-binding protein CbpA